MGICVSANENRRLLRGGLPNSGRRLDELDSEHARYGE